MCKAGRKVEQFMELKELYRTCRSYRAFKQDPVPDDVVEEMMEDVRIASSAANLMPLRYVVVREQENVEKMQDLVGWAGYLKGAGTPQKGHQPVMFIALIEAKGAGAFADVDLGIAANTLATAAWEKGFGSCILGNIKKDAIKELLDIPEEDNLRLVMAFGKPEHKAEIVEMKDGDVKYWRDENGDYHVPKRALDEIVKYR
jgi:FMN reductase [NAD(P)H]